MSKVRWQTMMSLDGYIAGPNDDMQWVFGIEGGPSPTIEEVLRSTGALLVGRRTQDVEDRLQPGFYGGAFRGPFLVLRHDPPSDPPIVKGVTGRFIDVDIEEAVRLEGEMTVVRYSLRQVGAVSSVGSTRRPSSPYPESNRTGCYR